MYSPQEFGNGFAAIVAALEHLSYIQIDTISVVERAHHHTLWNRVNKYRPDLLDKAVEQGDAFELPYGGTHFKMTKNLCD